MAMSTAVLLLGVLVLLGSSAGAAAADAAPQLAGAGQGRQVVGGGGWRSDQRQAQRRRLQQSIFSRPCPTGLNVASVVGTTNPFCAEAAQSLPDTTWTFAFYGPTVLGAADWIEVHPYVTLTDGSTVELSEADVSCFVLPLLNTWQFDSNSGNGSLAVQVRNCYFKTTPPRNMQLMTLRMVVRCDPTIIVPPANHRPETNGTWPLSAVNPPIGMDLRATASQIAPVCSSSATTGTFTWTGAAIGRGTNFSATIDGQPCSPGPSPAFLANPNPVNALITVTCNPPPGLPPASGARIVELTAFFTGSSPCGTSQLAASFTAPVITNELAVDRSTLPAICTTGVDTLTAAFRYTSKSAPLTTFSAKVDGGTCTPGPSPTSLSGDVTAALVTVSCKRPTGTWPAGSHAITLTASTGNCSTSATANIAVQPPPVVTVVPQVFRVNGRNAPRVAGCGDSNTVFTASFLVTATNTQSVAFTATIDDFLCTPPPSSITSAPSGTIVTVNCSRADGAAPSPGTHLLSLTATYAGITPCSGGSVTSAPVAVETPEPAQVSVTPQVVPPRPVCAGSTALAGRFLYSATSIPNTGVTTFVASVDGQPCATSPAPIIGNKPPPGTIVVVNCSKPDGSAFSPGPHDLTLTANYPGIPPCPNGSVTSRPITITVSDPPTVTLTASQPVGPTCYGGDVTVSFAYTITGATAGLTYKTVATSSPPGACRASAIKSPTGIVTVICFGVTAPVNSSITVSLELTAAGGAGCTAGKANATAVSRVICCQSGFGYARALTTANNETYGSDFYPATCWRHVEPVDDTNCLKPTGFAWGYFNRGPSAGVITAGIGTGCGGGTTVGYYSAVCTASDTLTVTVLHNRFTALRKPIGQLLWAGCLPPTGSNASVFEGVGGSVVSGNGTGSDRANDWPIDFPRLPGGGIQNATFPGYFPVPNLPCNRWRPTGYKTAVAGDVATYSFARPVPFTAKAVGCSCLNAYWSLFEQGSYTDDAGKAVRATC